MSIGFLLVVIINNGLIVNFGLCGSSGCTLPLAYKSKYATCITTIFGSANGFIVRKEPSSTLTTLQLRWDCFSSVGGYTNCNYICIGF